MSVGERITELRKKQSMSQAQLANEMSLSRQAVSKWENDQSSPDTLNLIKLADVLNTNVEFLATGRDAPQSVPPPSPPQILRVVEEVEKIVEVEKRVEVEKVVERIIEQPVIRRVVRTKYRRNPIELAMIGLVSFVIGLLLGFFL